MKLLLMSLLVVAGLCGQASRRPKDVSMNQDFELKHGQTVRVKGQKLKLTFTSVLEDSRCPTGEQCFRAGEGKVAVEASRPGERAVSLSLSTAAGSQDAGYHGYGIKLVELRPYPKSGDRLRPGDYVVKLRVYEGAPATTGSDASR